MPIHRVDGGYQWGNHGKVYHGANAKEKAERQAAAAHANGWHGDAEEDEETRKLAKRFKELDGRRAKVSRGTPEYLRLSREMNDIHRHMERTRNFKPGKDASEKEVSRRIKREYERGHPLKQAEAIAYKELGDESEAKKKHDEGRLTEKEKKTADPHVGARRDKPDDVYLRPSTHNYPVKVKRDGKWEYDRDLLLAAERDATMHHEDSIAEKAKRIREREFGPEKERHAQDWMPFALDRKSTRTVDENGFLHVPDCNISKAVVNPYRGEEIPGWKKLGLDPGKIYHLLRDPKELELAASSFNGVPLMTRHAVQTSDAPSKMERVGSVGTNTRFEHPYLKSDIVIWDDEPIAGVETEAKRELSCSYRYDPDMTEGEYEGTHYDGVMRNIRGNHVALVEEGRAGRDVLVGDQALGELSMAKDRKASDETEEEREERLERRAEDARRRLGRDETEVEREEREEKEGEEETEDERRERLRARDRRERRARDAKKRLGRDETEEEREKREAEDKAFDRRVRDECRDEEEEEENRRRDEEGDLEKDSRRNRDEKIEHKRNDEGEFRSDGAVKTSKSGRVEDKRAMDAAIRKAEENTIRRLNEIAEAKEAVRPFVGELAVAMDSASDIYAYALQQAGVDLAGIPPSAFGAMFRALPKPGKPPLARDASNSEAWFNDLMKGVRA